MIFGSAPRPSVSLQSSLSEILWLTEHVEEIAHRPIKGSEFFSLHSGSYRIPYLIDKHRKLIIVDDVGQHDAAYNRIKKLKL